MTPSAAARLVRITSDAPSLAQARQRHANDVCIEHRKQRCRHTVGDLPQIVVAPERRKCRKRDERSWMQRLAVAAWKAHRLRALA